MVLLICEFLKLEFVISYQTKSCTEHSLEHNVATITYTLRTITYILSVVTYLYSGYYHRYPDYHHIYFTCHHIFALAGITNTLATSFIYEAHLHKFVKHEKYEINNN